MRTLCPPTVRDVQETDPKLLDPLIDKAFVGVVLALVCDPTHNLLVIFALLSQVLPQLLQLARDLAQPCKDELEVQVLVLVLSLPPYSVVQKQLK